MVIDGYPLASECGLSLIRADDGGVTTGKIDPGNVGHYWRFLPVGPNVLVQSVRDDGVLISDDGGNLSVIPYDPSREQITYSPYAQWNFVIARRHFSGIMADLIDYNPGTAAAQGVDPDIFTAGAGGYAVRPQFNFDRNINVLGDGPYLPGSAVAAWDGWSNAAPNEVWVPLARTGQAPPFGT